MKKFLLSLFLLLTAVVSRAYDFKVDGIYYQIMFSEEQSVAVACKSLSTRGNKDAYLGDVVIPEKVSYDNVTYDVKTIDYRAFTNCTGLTSVTIPNSVTVIGKGVFGLCSGLTSVTIPNSVTEIEAQAFFRCSGLTFVSIGKNVTKIDSEAFGKCENLKSCYCFAESVPSTSSAAFSDVDMSSVVLHVPAASIQEYSSTEPWSDFGQITAIVDTFSVDGIYYRVRLPDELSVAVTYKGDSYYGYKERYSDSVVIPESVTYGDVTYRVTEIGANAFNGCSGLTAVTIPDGVTKISESAFNACSGLTAVAIPHSVKEVGANAFYGCSFTSVHIPDSVTTIGGGAFSGCSGLESIVVDAGNPVYDSRDNCNAIMETSSNKLVQGCKNTIIPDEVTEIGNAAFSGCSGLTAVTLPYGVTKIGDEAFYNCSGLTFVSIGSWMETIGASAFGNCESLKGCYCFAGRVPSAHSATFSGVDMSSAILHVPATSLEEYSSTAPWQDFGLITAIVDTFSVDGIYYRVTSIEELTVAVTYKGDSYYEYKERYSGSVVIPERVTYGGVPYKVTEIGEGAFYNCSGLTAVTIPNSVTTIGGGAFYDCSGLTAVTIPNSVTTIGGGAFSFCSGLESIVVDAGNPVYDSRDNCNAIMETSSNKLVQGCKNTIIPGEVTAIGADAFSGCNGLTAITLPEGVTEIGNGAFISCRNLTSIVIPESVRKIGGWAFNGCSSLIAVTIPEGVTEIGDGTFYDCRYLSFVSIPSSVTAIGDYAFYQCHERSDIYCFAESVPNTNWTAFKESQLYNATLHVPAASLDAYKTTNPWSSFRNVIAMGATGETFIVDGICYEIMSDEELTVAVARKNYMVYSGDVVIPESVTYSGQTYSVTSVGNKAFYYCPALTSVSIPNSVTEIGYQAFYDCRGLTSVTMSNNVTTIVEQTFYNCTSLASISIPDSATTIENYAFYGCTSLTSVVIPNNVTHIGNFAFYGCTGLTTSIIFSPKSVPNIGNKAFYNCKSLTSLSIPGGVAHIGDQAFYGCTSLASVSIGQDSSSIPDGTIRKIGSEAFLECSSLISVSMGNGVKAIGEKAFYNCKKLASVIIPNSVTAIGRYAFQGCSALASLTLGDGVTNIDNNAFYNCESLTSVVIPNSVTEIGTYAFQGCSALTSLTIGNNVTTIGAYAFRYCNALENVYCLAEHVPATSTNIFDKVELSSATLHVPATSLEAYRITNPWSGFGQIVAIGEGDGIEQLTSEAFTNPTIYDLNGRRTAKMQKGINLLRSADGRVRKVIRSKE